MHPKQFCLYLLQHTSVMRATEPRLEGAAINGRNKSIADKNGTTPHPPAVFGSIKFFSFIFLQTISPARAAAGVLPENQN